MEPGEYIAAIRNNVERSRGQLNGLTNRRRFSPLDRLNTSKKGMRGVKVRPRREMDTIGGNEASSACGPRPVRKDSGRSGGDLGPGRAERERERKEGGRVPGNNMPRNDPCAPKTVQPWPLGSDGSG